MASTQLSERIPTELNPINHARYLEVDKDKLRVRYVGKGNHAHDVGSIQANKPIPTDVFAYYYEVTVNDAGARGSFAVGFADAHFELTRKPGWEHGSYGYHADDGHKYCGSERGEAYGPPCGAGDVIGCGIRFDDCSIFFTRNGAFLGKAFTYPPSLQLYATIGLHSPNESLSVNFGAPGGQPFAFDLDGHVSRDKARMYSSLSSFDVPADDVLTLVRSYCLHYGYAETHAALPSCTAAVGTRPSAAAEAHSEAPSACQAAENGGANGVAASATGHTSAPVCEPDATTANGAAAPVKACGQASDRAHGALASLRDRHAVRECVMRGDIDGCIALLRERFPTVLDVQLPPAHAAAEGVEGAHPVPAQLSPASSRGRAAMDIAGAPEPGGAAQLPNEEEESVADLRRLLMQRRSTVDSELDQVPPAALALRDAGRARAGDGATDSPNGGEAGTDGRTATMPLSREQLMQQKWRAIFQLRCQGFIELIRRHEFLDAVSYGQAHLAPLRDSLAGADAREKLDSVVALLAYAGLAQDGADGVVGDVPRDAVGLRTMMGASARGSYSRIRGSCRARSHDRQPARICAGGSAAHAAAIFGCTASEESLAALDSEPDDRRGQVRRLMSYEQREHTADLLNAAILAEVGVDSTSAIEGLIRQLFVAHEVAREANGGRGEVLSLTA